MILLYSASRSAVPLRDALEARLGHRVSVRNPRYFRSVNDCEPAEQVYLDGAWPLIEDAYSTRAIPVCSAHVMSQPQTPESPPVSTVGVAPVVEVRHRGGAYFDVFENGERITPRGLARHAAEQLAKERRQ